jgi:exonuclease III
MKIATWNVNSVRARLERLAAWLQKAQPDILCLQELKTQDTAFPHDAIREAGCHAAVFGQKTFNGVGILSRVEPQNVLRGMDDGIEDPQARFLAVQIGEIHVISAYRMLAFPKNNGLRLDYIFATAPLAARCTSAEIDRQERKGAKPSDHAPIIATFDYPQTKE